MFAKKALLALAATASLAAPVSAFAYDRDRGDGYDRGGHEQRYDQRYDRRDDDRRFDRDRRDRDNRRYVCRRGVFYMRDSWCARHRRDWNYWR